MNQEGKVTKQIKLKPATVHIGGETGERVTIERNVVSEHVVYRSDIGQWPEDGPSQRAWALSVVVQKLVPLFKTDDDLEEIFESAQKVVDWVQGRD